MTLLTPTAVLVGRTPVDLAAPPLTCPTCAVYAAGAKRAHELRVAAEEREARLRDELARLEDELARTRAIGEKYEPVKAYRAAGGVV